MAAVQLVVLEGPDAGREFDLSGATTVGRDPSAGIVIDDPDASRRHASLSVDGTTVTVEDLGSTNGTFVNGGRLSAARQLGPTDKLRIGMTVFEVRAAAAGEAGATRAGTLPDLDDLQVTAPRRVPDFAKTEPPSAGPPGGAGGPPGGAPAGGPPPPSPGPPPPSAPPPAYPQPPAPGGPPIPYVPSGAYPVNYAADYPAAGIARWRCFFQGLLAWPHFFVLFFVGIGAWLAFVVAWWAILFTGRYPRGIFGYVSGTLRWAGRVNGFTYLLTEQYPPFSLEDMPAYPVRVQIDYPEGGIARWRPLVHYFMALPHIFVLSFLGFGAFVALIGAWFSILFTGNYPPGIFNFVTGVQRWTLRVQAFVLLMTEQYPPFSLE